MCRLLQGVLCRNIPCPAELTKRTSTPTGTTAPSEEDSSGDEKAPLTTDKGGGSKGVAKGGVKALAKAETDASRCAVVECCGACLDNVLTIFIIRLSLFISVYHQAVLTHE